jgi:predicted porin
MNKNIKHAVAGAVLAMSASAAHAGIVIPAGDWTLDVNGNVNAFANWTKADHAATITGGVAVAKDKAGEDTTQGINTGLLPAWLGFTGKTRQNDTDVEFTISIQPNASNNGSTGDGAAVGSNTLFRQSYVSFGDKSWGSIKLGKDIGIFASDAILNDMTLLGVGGLAGNSGASTTFGGIGTGYIYAAWKGQIAYTTPNMNGFQATVGITNPNQGLTRNILTVDGNTGLNGAHLYQDRFGMEGKASYSFAAEALTGKIWVGGASYKVKGETNSAAASALGTVHEYTADVADIGVNLNAGNAGLTAYYYRGDGVGTTILLGNGFSTAHGKRSSDGGYLQGTYVLPTKTKLGVAYGKSNLDRAAGESASDLVEFNERYTVGLYHPLTKHLNLVAEYNDIESRSHAGAINKNTTGSLGAILFF